MDNINDKVSLPSSGYYLGGDIVHIVYRHVYKSWRKKPNEIGRQLFFSITLVDAFLVLIRLLFAVLFRFFLHTNSLTADSAPLARDAPQDLEETNKRP